MVGVVINKGDNGTEHLGLQRSANPLAAGASLRLKEE